MPLLSSLGELWENEMARLESCSGMRRSKAAMARPGKYFRISASSLITRGPGVVEAALREWTTT